MKVQNISPTCNQEHHFTYFKNGKINFNRDLICTNGEMFSTNLYESK